MPTYHRYNSLAYNLIRDTRDMGDNKTISREQLGRSNFTRDQMLAANASGFDKSTLIREAARGSSTLRNLHQQMDNTSTTGGFGGLGYAKGKNDVPTKDYATPMDGNAIACLISMGKIPDNPENYLTLSQAISKPHIGVYGRYAQVEGLAGFIDITNPETPELHSGPANEVWDLGYEVWEYPHIVAISSMANISQTETTTSLEIEGITDLVIIPVVLEPDTTYWFVRLYNKTTSSEELFSIPYASRHAIFFGEEAITNNYPNVPLSRSLSFDQDYINTNSGDIGVFPDAVSGATTAYYAIHQAELDQLDLEIAELSEQIAGYHDYQNGSFDVLASLGELIQDNIAELYIYEVYPALVAEGLDPKTYTQSEIDAYRAAAPDATFLNLDIIEEAQDTVLSHMPDLDVVATFHTFATSRDYLAAENALADAVDIKTKRKYDINLAAPRNELENNINYSEWGPRTFFEEYTHWDTMLETFMSEGFPEHTGTKRFLAMIGQKPRTMSDVIKRSVQTDPPTGGNSRTLCDQLILGCQATPKMDYAEMRYLIEFARAAWWHTPFAGETTLDKQNINITSDAGPSAWGVQYIEESMANVGDAGMKSNRTRWGSCEVWIEEGEVVGSDGAFGTCSMNQTTGDVLTSIEHPEHADWIGGSTGLQTLEGSYNITNGYVLRVKITGLATIDYVLNRSRLRVFNYAEYPIVPLFYNIIRNIPQNQICQLQNEFIFVRSHTHWTQHKSGWVQFRDGTLYKIVGFVLQVVGLVLAIPSGGATLTWAAVGTALMYMALMYAASKVLTHFIKQWGLDNTWIGAVVAAVMAVVAIYFGMPPTDAILLSTTVSADAMSKAYLETNLAEAKEAAGVMASLDLALDEISIDIEKMDEQQNWLDFYSASDLVKMRQEAVDYVRTETPDKYYERMMGYQSNMLNLGGLEYLYDYGLDLELP